jgi:dihydroxyacetone kinase
MKKLINDPNSFVDECLEGILLAKKSQLRAVGEDLRAIVDARCPRPGKVGVVTGGGSGHLPIFLGYVGPGLCTGVAVGNVFSSPSVDQILAATRASNGGAGVLFIYGNYGGDVLNFDDAAEIAIAEGIQIETVLVADDVASAPRERKEERRGVAGLAFAFKVAGAAAARGDSLADVASVARNAIDQMGSMGVGLSPTVLPAAGQPTFTLEEGEMEVGIGIHGERGIRRAPIAPVDEIAEELFGAIASDLELASGDSIAVLVNGMGATPLEELYLLYRRINQMSVAAGYSIDRNFVGEYATSLEMAGASVTIMLLNEQLKELLDLPSSPPISGMF